MSPPHAGVPIRRNKRPAGPARNSGPKVQQERQPAPPRPCCEQGLPVAAPLPHLLLGRVRRVVGLRRLLRDKRAYDGHGRRRASGRAAQRGLAGALVALGARAMRAAGVLYMPLKTKTRVSPLKTQDPRLASQDQDSRLASQDQDPRLASQDQDSRLASPVANTNNLQQHRRRRLSTRPRMSARRLRRQGGGSAASAAGRREVRGVAQTLPPLVRDERYGTREAIQVLHVASPRPCRPRRANTSRGSR